jgi:hypothetical protein
LPVLLSFLSPFSTSDRRCFTFSSYSTVGEYLHFHYTPGVVKCTYVFPIP